MQESLKQSPSFWDKKRHKLQTVYREHGLAGAVAFCINFLVAKTGWYHDHIIFGKLVERQGNIVKIDGCRFHTDSPIIPITMKSRFFLGRYERKERKAIRSFLDPSLPVIELGASIGVVSCITNKKLKNPQKHVVVEANPELIPLLTANRGLNDCSFTIINKASGYGSKEAVFYLHERFASGSMHRVTDKAISVPTTTLADIFSEYHFEYANLICDIEGGELDLLKYEKELISRKIFQIIVEVHPSFVGEEAVRRFREELKDIGFREIRTGVDPYGEVLVLENTKIKKLVLPH